MKLKVEICGYDVATTDEATKLITQQISQLKLKFSGPMPFPTKRRLYSLPISPFKHKDSQEQFDKRTHRRIIHIFDPSPNSLESLAKLQVPHTVGLKLRVLS